jgi:hypothetical protein
MNDLSDRLRRERELSVPPHLTTEVERMVMRRIRGKSPGQRARQRSLELALAGVLTVVLAVVILHDGRRSAPPSAPQFTESVILLDDHVCIWLEPVDDAAAKEVAP